MKNLLPLVAVFLFGFIGSAQEQRIVSGKVTDNQAPIENVNVYIKEKQISTVTDADGKYTIKAETGDVLQFAYTGMKTISIRVEDVTRFLSPVMVPDVTELEEVTVKSSRRISQKDLEEDYVLNKNIIRTAFGYLDADRAAGNVRTLDDSEINPVNVNVFALLQNRFPGVQVTGNLFGANNLAEVSPINQASIASSGVFIRGRGSLTNQRAAIFDIDGQIFTNIPPPIDIGNIKRIAILNNLATTTRYGSIGAGGVIVINTFSGTPQNDKIVDRARLKNNYVNTKVLTRAEVANNNPTYLKELEASTSFDDAKKVYDQYESSYYSSPYFYLDAYTYFSENHDDMDYADAIINENFALFDDNPVLLKALAYRYEEQQRFEKANAIFKEVFILRPNYAQSYMDMANSYRSLNEVKQAASIYARYDYLVQEGFMEQDSIGFGPVMEREFNNLLVLNRNAVVNSTKSGKLYVAQEEFEGTRLVFEWNDSEAEFDLQFVNPENQYYKWKHSLADNEKTIYREKDFGYSVKEYLIDGSLPGTWGVNVKYLGNKSLTPTYLKATVYYNYGARSQRKETKVFKLSLKDVNQELFKVQSVGSIVTK